jgi:PAS domain S-box-containing protein
MIILSTLSGQAAKRREAGRMKEGAVRTEAIHVLLVEDNPGDVRLVRELVRDVPGLSVHHVDHLAAAIGQLASGKADVVLLDLGLPDSQGLATLRAMLQAGCAAPIVVLTGQDDDALGLTVVQEGAQDFLSKSCVTKDVLTRAVRYAIGRHDARAMLRESETQLRRIIDNLQDAYFRADLSGRLTMVSPSAARMYGYESIEEMLQQPAESLYSDPQERAVVHDEVYRNGRVNDRVGLGRRKDGTTFWVSMNAQICYDASGKIIGAEGIVRDITERKRTEEALERTTREWQTTFDATNDAIWLLDKEQRVVRSNEAAERIFQHPAETCIGKHCWEIVHGKKEPLSECPVLLARQSLHRESMELQIGERWFEVTCDPIVHTAGQYAGAVHIVSDITERKRAETELRSQLDELQRWHDATLGREGRIQELKREINRLLVAAGQPPRFASVTDPESASAPAKDDRW